MSLLTNPGKNPDLYRSFPRQEWTALFDHFYGDILFYFSGHGTPTNVGGCLVTQDGEVGDFGPSMNDLLTLANRSKAQSVLLILDCCYSGSLGNPPNLQGDGSVENQAQLREGVTILAASRPTEPAVEVGGHGVFTDLVVGALRGGAADVRGRVSAASIYAYVEASLGAWDQRPLYKTHANHLDPVRLCKPAISDDLLRTLPILFPTDTSRFQLDPTFEETTPSALEENVQVFKNIKKLQIARLVEAEAGDDLYWTAMKTQGVYLTPLG